MADQQLVDYIKKARQAGQTDDQTRALLYKNDWTESEVSEAFTALNPQPEVNSPKPQPQPQVVSQPVQTQPKPQPQVVNQPQPQIQPQKPQTGMPFVRKSHTLLKLLIVLIILAVLGGAAYFVAGQYLNIPLIWNPFRPNPETVIDKMLTNMKNVKSSHMSTQIEIKTIDDKRGLSISVNGGQDMSDVNNPKANFTITLNTTMMGSTDSLSVPASIDFIANGKIFYIKLSDSVLWTGVLPGSEQIKGKWFKIDQDSIKSLSQTSGGQAPLSAQTILPNTSQVDNLELNKKIQDAISSEKLLSVDKQFSDEVVSGQNAYHYSLKISKEKLENVLNKIMILLIQEQVKIQNNGGAASTNPLSQNIAQAFIKTFVDVVGDINMEMWIGKNDFLLYKSKIDKTVDLSKLYSGLSQIEIKFDTVNSDFNKPISVQDPAGAQKIEDVLLPVLRIQKIRSDMAQIAFVASTLAPNKDGSSGSYYTLCSHGWLNGDLNIHGKTLVELNNDIANQGAKNPTCFANVQNYCVSTKLPDGSYLCVGKNGIGTTRCLSTSTICK